MPSEEAAEEHVPFQGGSYLGNSCFCLQDKHFPAAFSRPASLRFVFWQKLILDPVPLFFAYFMSFHVLYFIISALYTQYLNFKTDSSVHWKKERSNEEVPGFHPGMPAGSIRRGAAGPCYTEYHLKLGEISSYPPGYKENGSVFCRNNSWIVCGEAVLGRRKRSLQHLQAHLSLVAGGRERTPRNGTLRLCPNGDGPCLRQPRPRQKQLAHRHCLPDLPVCQSGDSGRPAGFRRPAGPALPSGRADGIYSPAAVPRRGICDPCPADRDMVYDCGRACCGRKFDPSCLHRHKGKRRSHGLSSPFLKEGRIEHLLLIFLHPLGARFSGSKTAKVPDITGLGGLKSAMFFGPENQSNNNFVKGT